MLFFLLIFEGLVMISIANFKLPFCHSYVVNVVYKGLVNYTFAATVVRYGASCFVFAIAVLCGGVRFGAEDFSVMVRNCSVHVSQELLSKFCCH